MLTVLLSLYLMTLILLILLKRLAITSVLMWPVWKNRSLSVHRRSGTCCRSCTRTRAFISVGLWESHGKHYINGGVKAGRHSSCTLAPHNQTTHVGFQKKDKATNSSLAYGHAKGAKDKMNSFYTSASGSDLLDRVQEELYAADYKLWKLVNANGNKLSRGKDPMKELSDSDKC